MNRDADQARGRQGRFIALLLAFTGIAWLTVQVVGASQGWTVRTLAFFDLAALAAFAMALFMAFGLWRARRNNKD